MAKFLCLFPSSSVTAAVILLFAQVYGSSKEPASTWQRPTLAFKLVFHILARLLDHEQRQLFR